MEFVLLLIIGFIYMIYVIINNFIVRTRIFEKLNTSKFKNYYILITIILLIFSIVIISAVVKRGEERIKNRTINALVQADGSVFIEDIWDIQVVNSSTLFQSFGSGVSEKNFSNVIVSYYDEILEKWIPMTENKDISYTGKELLNYYHAGIFEGQFEIAWGVGLENSRARRKYKLEYTVNGPVKKYLDAGEYYHQFVAENFELPIENFYALITFPAPLRTETSYIWGHGAPTGEIYFKEGKIEVKANNVPKKTFIEARVLFPEEIIYMAPEIKYNRKDSVLAEEKINTENTIIASVNNVSRERMLNQAVSGVIIYLALVILFEVSQIIGLMKKYPKGDIRKWERYTDLPKTKLNIFAANMIYKDKGSKNFLITVLMKLSHHKFLEIIEIKEDIDLKSKSTSIELFDQSIQEKTRIVSEIAQERDISINLVEVAQVFSAIERDYRKTQATLLKVKANDINKVKFKLNLKEIEEAELDTDEQMVVEFLKKMSLDKRISDSRIRSSAKTFIKKYKFDISEDIFIEATKRYIQEVEIDKGHIYIEQYQLVNAIANKFKEFDAKYKQILKQVKQQGESEEIYDTKKELKSKTLIYKLIFEILIYILIIFSIINKLIGTLQFNENAYILAGLSVIIFTIILTIINRVQYSKLDPPLTNSGYNIREEYKGLYNFLNNDSFISEYPESSIIIWGEFLVLATYFGIAEKVLKTLKRVHPDLSTELEVSNYSYNNMYNVLRIIDVANLSQNNIKMERARSAFSSGSSFVSSGGGFSSSGGGGGFTSGGGGGFGGGGRRW